MVVYKIQVGDYVYIGSTTRGLSQRIQEHNYRLGDPEAHREWARTKVYSKLRELGVERIINNENCFKICDGGKIEEQLEMDKVPMEFSLNSSRSIA
jgi:hypothetical protein